MNLHWQLLSELFHLSLLSLSDTNVLRQIFKKLNTMLCVDCNQLQIYGQKTIQLIRDHKLWLLFRQTTMIRIIHLTQVKTIRNHNPKHDRMS